MISLEPLGDRAFLARLESDALAAGWAAAVRAKHLRGVVDVVAAYANVAVFADPDQVELENLRADLEPIAPASAGTETRRVLVIPVRYDGADLAEVASQLGLDPREVAALHAGVLYTVQAIGFLPGFPYAGPLPAKLIGLPRRDTPRVRVPAGSVAIAGRQTGIYPGESPGGWHLLGRTPLRIVDMAAGYFPIRVGDRLRFEPIGDAEFAARAGEGL